ncbi:hypothetical protein HUT18_09885 [Streptomyces sp. NA04227]|nr:hypothetical protein [Streptomyces sp. NA04227]QKW06667.1 hypothetical protein HUT18_09885 [Streptomyces sp. NA04227]
MTQAHLGSRQHGGGSDPLPGEPWPGPPTPPTPDGGPGVPNPPKKDR